MAACRAADIGWDGRGSGAGRTSVPLEQALPRAVAWAVAPGCGPPDVVLAHTCTEPRRETTPRRECTERFAR